MKVEGSIFTGREPDEDRYDFDRPRFDSYSGRLSWNPTQNLAMQVSYGYIKSPEALEPDLNDIAQRRLPFTTSRSDTIPTGRTLRLGPKPRYRRGQNAVVSD